MNLLEIENVHLSYCPKMVLQNISLDCKTGEIIGIFGRNGSGKSSLLKTIYGVQKAQSVTLRYNSEILLPQSVIPQQKIAYLPQHSFLPKRKKVRDMIPLVYPDGKDQDLIFYAPGVHGFENRRIGELSLGQLRYFELLLIGHLKHDFLLLDEPFSMVEPLYKEAIKNTLLHLKKSKGIILTDHYYEDVLAVSDRNFLIKDHNKITIADKSDLITHAYLNAP